MIARKPDVIFSIPIDPQSEAAAYKKAAAAGIKLVFMDNVPVGMAPGKDYVSVTASDNEQNAAFAAHELAEAIGKKGEVGVITLVYDYYYSVAARKIGALKALKGIVNLSVRWAEGRRFFSEVRSGRSACLGDLAPNPERALARSAAAVGSDGFGIGNVEEIRYLIVNR